MLRTSGTAHPGVVFHIHWAKNGCIFSLWLQFAADRFAIDPNNPAAWPPKNRGTARPRNLKNDNSVANASSRAPVPCFLLDHSFLALRHQTRSSCQSLVGSGPSPATTPCAPCPAPSPSTVHSTPSCAWKAAPHFSIVVHAHYIRPSSLRATRDRWARGDGFAWGCCVRMLFGLARHLPVDPS